MSTPRDEFDIDALLRQATERLAPPDGSWELISRRARRRKWAKASVAVTAGVIVVAGAVPAVIAVRHSGGEQSVAIANTASPPAQQRQHHASTQPAPTVTTPATSPTATAPAPLAGFVPDSLTFVSQTDGYLWGTVPGSHAGVIAHTTNGGSTWTSVPAPPVMDSASGAGIAGDNQIRFGSAEVGFVYGALYYVTTDGGQSWHQYSAPGYIDDLETVHQQVWALVRPSQLSTTVRLYSATTADPTLRRVTSVALAKSTPGADSIAINGGLGTAVSVSVIAGKSSFWFSPNGVTWKQRTDPCQIDPQSAVLSTLDLHTVLAACGWGVGGSSEHKQTFVSTNSGRSWTPTSQAPGTLGTMQTFAAGTSNDLIVGTTHGAQLSTDGGSSWRPANAPGITLGFVGFISLHHIVAISARADSATGAFATSTNSGRNWQVHEFS